MHKIIDNPNPKAVIGFLSYTPFHFYVFKNIYKHLPNAEFIVGDPYPKESLLHINDLIDFFYKQKGVYWRFIDFFNPKVDEDKFYRKYKLLVSTSYHNALSIPGNEQKKLVRVLYGHAKDPWNFGPWSVYFDLVLSYGKYSQKFLSVYGNAVIVGNPKFDDWFLGKIDKKEIEALTKLLDPAKKTILYLPTYGSLSSIDKMHHALSRIAADYNVIIRPHHHLNFFTPKRLIRYKKSEKIILRDAHDNIQTLLKVADIVVGDNSGAIFDAILADRPIILIDFLNKAYFGRTQGRLFDGRSELGLGVTTNPDSIEQRIKNPKEAVGSCIVQRDKKNITYQSLQRALKEAQQKEYIFKKRRKRIRNEVFSYTDGKSGKRAANEIHKLLSKTKPKRNFLADSVFRYLAFLKENTGGDAIPKIISTKEYSFLPIDPNNGDIEWFNLNFGFRAKILKIVPHKEGSELLTNLKRKDIPQLLLNKNTQVIFKKGDHPIGGTISDLPKNKEVYISISYRVLSKQWQPVSRIVIALG